MRLRFAVLVGVLNWLAFSQACWAEPIQVLINSQMLPLSSAPLSENYHTMVPMREVFQALKAEVEWDDYTQTITATRSDKTIKIQVGKGTAVSNGQVINLDVPAKLHNDITYVPLRFVGEALGARVSWSEEQKRIYIECEPVLQPISNRPLTVKEIAKRNQALVLLKVYGEAGELLGTGSGFVVKDDGQVVTNYHVVSGGSSVEVVTQDNKVFLARGVTGYSKEKDFAILQLAEANNLAVVSLGDSAKLELGEDVVAIGSPLALQNTVSTGIVSGFRDWQGLSYIQITAPLSPGSSGGALFNMYGAVVGITAAGFEEGQNLNLAIPINEVKGYLAGTEIEPISELALMDNK